MVRHSLSKLQGILEMPGFKGYPTGGNMKSGFSSMEIEKQASFEIPEARIVKKLNNSQRWCHANIPMPQHREDAYRKERSDLTRMNATPLSQTDKANNPDTAMVMSKHSVPYYPDLAEVQQQADVQRALGDASSTEQYGRKPTLGEMQDAKMILRKGTPNGFARLSNKKPVDENVDMSFMTRDQESLVNFFETASKVRDQEMVANLASKGFTEDEVRVFLEKRRERDIDKASREPVSDMLGIEKAIMAMRSVQTGTNATGIGSLAATQQPSIVSSMLKNEDRPGMFRNLSRNVPQPAAFSQPSTIIDEVQSVQSSDYPTSAASMARGARAKRKKISVAKAMTQSTLNNFFTQ